MESGNIGETKDAIGRIGFGGLALGGHYGPIEKSEAIRTIRTAVEAGITFFDASPTYGGGLAEQILGAALGSERDSVQIATKVGTGRDVSFTLLRNNDRTTIIKRIEESLKRLRRDYIDLYQIYGPDPHTPLHETMETLEELRQAGKVRLIGFCSPDTSTLREALKHGRVNAVQVPYNILNRTIDAEVLPFCRAARIHLHACEPYLCGLLCGGLHKNSVFDTDDRRATDRRFRGEQFRSNIEIVNRLRAYAYQEELTLLQLSLGWTLQNPSIARAICGATRPEQVVETVAAAQTQLTPEQIIAVDQIVGEDKYQQPQ
jgi:aryl-alcohol dehydrogenase-like predicted oxidoreductase